MNFLFENKFKNFKCRYEIVERNPIKIDDKQLDKNEFNSQIYYIRNVIEILLLK